VSRAALDDAWKEWLVAQQRALELIQGAALDAPLDIVEGYRYVSRLAALALTIYVECDDPLWPRFELQLDPYARKFACDSPDTIYWRAPVSSRERYRVTGFAGDAPYTAIALQSDLYTGRTGRKGTLAQYSLDELSVGADGIFELTLGVEAGGPNPIALPDDVSDILIRQTVLDPSDRARAWVRIERLGGAPGPRPALTDAEWIEGMRKASLFLPSCIAMFLTMGRNWGRHVNAFRYQPARRNKQDAEGGDPHVDYFQGCWKLASGEALSIEFTPVREFRLWSFVACNSWSESLDYSGGWPVATNDRKALRDAEGRIRLILSDEDPGHPNWISTTGHREGLMLLRWLLATEPPAMPVTRVVRVDDIRAGRA